MKKKMSEKRPSMGAKVQSGVWVLLVPREPVKKISLPPRRMEPV